MYYETLMDTPYGVMRLQSDDEALTHAGFISTAEVSGTNEISNIKRDGPLAAPLQLALDWYQRYFDGEEPDPAEVPIRPEGTPFQMEVWSIVRQIPYGEVLSYGEIARKIAAQRGIPRMASQAVGGAMKANKTADFMVPRLPHPMGDGKNKTESPITTCCARHFPRGAGARFLL